MDCAQSNKQFKEQLEMAMAHKETDVIPDRSNSNSSSTSESRDSALQPKPDVFEFMGAVQTAENLSLGSGRIQSSSQIRLSGVLENHDPNRIPISIFSGKPSNPMEWSTASNESLFSIHVGNNSFSRENFNFFTKSGELMLNPNSSLNLPSLPPLVEPPRVESKTGIAVNVSAESVTSTGPQIPAISVHQKEPTTTPTDELRGRQSVSNDSMNSSHSFQFPLLASEGATPKTTSSVSTDSGATPQQQPVTKLQTKSQQSMKQESPEHESPSPSHEITAPYPATNSGPGWFSCFSWCQCR